MTTPGGTMPLSPDMVIELEVVLGGKDSKKIFVKGYNLRNHSLVTSQKFDLKLNPVSFKYDNFTKIFQ